MLQKNLELTSETDLSSVSFEAPLSLTRSAKALRTTALILAQIPFWSVAAGAAPAAKSSKPVCLEVILQKYSRFILLDKSVQTIYIYDKGKLIKSSKVSTGKISKATEAGPGGVETSTGHFHILTKEPVHKSNLYRNVYMRWAMRFCEGKFFHQLGNMKDLKYLGQKASHGCVRENPAFARWFFKWAREGDEVFVTERLVPLKPPVPATPPIVSPVPTPPEIVPQADIIPSPEPSGAEIPPEPVEPRTMQILARSRAP